MEITRLQPNEVFVFGSNLAGRHGKGAALQAATFFGAAYGVGEGLTGSSYAFPTLTERFQKRSMDDLMNSVVRLYECCIENPTKRFLLTKVGCGLAGFEESEMMKLFDNPPKNLILPEDWTVVKY